MRKYLFFLCIITIGIFAENSALHSPEADVIDEEMAVIEEPDTAEEVVTDDAIIEEAAEIDENNLILIDQIEAIVYGQEAAIITKSDLDRPSLGGGFSTLEDLIFNEQIFLDAIKHHIPQDQETVDAYLTQIQREHNLSAEQLEEIFTNSGYTLEEGRQQLQKMNMINTMIDIKIRSNVIIPRKDVEEYYKNNPTIIEATYTLQHAFVPQSKKLSSQKQYDLLVKYAKTGKGVKGISWGEPFTIHHADIAASKRFIYTMELNQISLPQIVSGGFELFKLIEKTPERIKTLEESYRDIVDILRQPKYQELLREYREHLANSTAVIQF